jgi:hypothetical protein
MEAYLIGRQLEGLTEAHLDRLDKLFSRYVPKEVQQTPIKEVAPKALRAIFENASLSPSNLRVLRPLLKDLFRRYQVFAGGSNAAEKAADLLPVIGYGDWPEKSKYLPVWTESKFQNFFKWLLEKNDDYWQQALCLRLFFRVDQVPLTTALSATWDQFYMVNVSRSFGSNQTEKKPAWYWSDKHWLRHVFRDSDLPFIAELLRRQSPSPYLFPSPHGRSVGHIRTVDHVWRNALAEFKLPYASPREFKSHYKALNLEKGWWTKELPW